MINKKEAPQSLFFVLYSYKIYRQVYIDYKLFLLNYIHKAT